jgi:uncharacterized RDD family membrane protein YckC
MARRPPRNRNRTVITPEGVALPLVLASRGSRAAALFIDLILIVTAMTVTTLTLIWIAGGVGIKIDEVDADGPKTRAVQALAIVWIIAMFLFRNAWFLFFELGPRGATPGKRVTGIRIAARGTERLTTEAVIARNIVRDIELFMPIVFISSAIASGSDTDVAGWAGAIWCAIFLLFPFFNRDSLRCGDVIAGTWVVEAQNRKLGQALSVSAPAAAADQAFTFTPAELAFYGEYELQTLERVLREDKDSALDDVADAISRKIGRPYPYRAERVFLESYYIQLRAQLEQGLRLGRRKADKYAA